MDKNTKVVFDRLENFEFNSNPFINLNGSKIDTKEDLATLCNIYRNPKYETFRIIYVKDSKIVGQDSYTNKIPNSVRLFKKRDKKGVDTKRGIAEIKRKIQRLNAEGYYLEHNHISENAKASAYDMFTTIHLSEKIDGFLGHIILGTSNKYSFISQKDIDSFNIPKEELIDSKELKLMEEKLANNDYKDIRIDSRESLVALLKTIENPKEYSTAILTNPANRIQVILNVPNRMFNQSREELKGYFRNIARNHGATRVFIGTEDKNVYVKACDHFDYGTIKDIIFFDKLPYDTVSYQTINEKHDYDLFDKTFYDSLREFRESEEKYMREEKLKILYKKVGKEPIEMEIENTLEAKQKLVDGLIEVVPYYDAVLICNEEGKLMNLLPNVAFDCDYIAGDFFIVGDDYENGDFKSLTKEQIEEYKKDLEPRSFEYKDLIPKDKTKDDTKEKNVKEKENLELE